MNRAQPFAEHDAAQETRAESGRHGKGDTEHALALRSITSRAVVRQATLRGTTTSRVVHFYSQKRGSTRATPLVSDAQV